jgi:hypothetical protein
MTTRSTTKARRSASYLLDVVDDDLGEATSEDTERGQDGTKRVDPHEVDLSLWNELQRTQEVSRNMSRERNAEVVTLRIYHRDGGQTKDLNDGCNGVKDAHDQGCGLEARHLSMDETNASYQP